MNQTTPPNLPQNNPSEEDDLYQIKDIVRRYIRNWYWVFFSLAIFVLGAFLINRYTPRVYRSSAQFFVKEQESEDDEAAF
jgi:uncharacterized protein involved in exopolysaccharide biosynthesis